MSDATRAHYAVSGVGVSGMMVSGWCDTRLLVQIGPYWTPTVSGMMVSGLGTSDYTGHGAQLQYIDGLNVKQSGQLDVPTAEFSIVIQDGERAPQHGDPVVIAIGTLSARVFGGWLQSAKMTPLGVNRRQYACRAVGWAESLQHLLIESTWRNRWAREIVREVLQEAAPWMETDLEIEQGTCITEAVADLETPLVVCTRLAAQSGLSFWVDAQRVAHFARAEMLPASWDITDQERFANLTISEDSSGLVNRVMVRYSQVEALTQSVSGDGETREFLLPSVPYEVTALVLQEPGQPDTPVSFGRHYAEDNSEQDFSIDYSRGVIVTRAHPILTVGQSLVLSGTVRIPARLTRCHQASIERYGFYDLLIEDRDGLLCLEDARAVADAELAAHAEPHLTVSYTRTEPLMTLLPQQLRPGMQQRLQYWDYDRTLTVRKCTLTVLAPADDHRLIFQQDVSLGTAPVDLAEAIAQTTTATERVIDERSATENYED